MEDTAIAVCLVLISLWVADRFEAKRHRELMQKMTGTSEAEDLFSASEVI